MQLIFVYFCCIRELIKSSYKFNNVSVNSFKILT